MKNKSKNENIERFCLEGNCVDEEFTAEVLHGCDVSMLTKKQKRVLAALMYISGIENKSDDGKFFVENKFLCHVCGVDNKTLIKATKVLQEAGVVERKPGKRMEASTYSVNEGMIKGGALRKLGWKNENFTYSKNSTHNKNSTHKIPPIINENSTLQLIKNNNLKMDKIEDKLQKIIELLEEQNSRMSEFMDWAKNKFFELDGNSTHNKNSTPDTESDIETESIITTSKNTSNSKTTKEKYLKEKKEKRNIKEKERKENYVVTGEQVVEIDDLVIEEHAGIEGESPSTLLNSKEEIISSEEEDDLSAYAGDNEEKVRNIVLDYRNSSIDELIELSLFVGQVKASKPSLRKLITKLKKELASQKTNQEETRPQEDKHAIPEQKQKQVPSQPIPEKKKKAIPMIKLEDGTELPLDWHEAIQQIKNLRPCWPCLVDAANVYSLARYVQAKYFFADEQERQQRVQELIDLFKAKTKEFLDTVSDDAKRKRLKESLAKHMLFHCRDKSNQEPAVDKSA